VGCFSIDRCLFGISGDAVNPIHDKKDQNQKKTKPPHREIIPKEGFVVKFFIVND
jgi:hypothetical protein